jgi:hypothetical protein
MKNTEDIVSEHKFPWNNTQSDLESFGLQYRLGRNEARDTFDREWKKVSAFLDEQSHRLRRQGHWASQLMGDLEAQTKALMGVLKQPLPGSERVYDSWRDGLLRTVYTLEFIMGELYPVLEAEERELLSSFRIKMEVYRTRLLITPWSDLASLQPQLSQLISKMEEVMVWRDRDAAFARERIQRFGKEIGVSFEHMKKAFSGLFG